ncbi:hypothetical protein PsorP6_014242 [Peronosclerospora sorghi]|uniref:Uncharacterized protein n=1 Tax=Peronosclerospora sorghi TaxID=230839 RepID=A0ACC0VHC2_9STRA|nr:hypothetical protein PsorP6_014242 [Peronosclerospora sorghi]
MNRPDVVDLTSSGDEETRVERTRGRHDDVEILEPVPTVDRPHPTPLRLKRRRARAEAKKGATGRSTRPCAVDRMRSTESTSVNMQNLHVVQKFTSQLKCTICLDVLERMTSTLCGHIFCAQCIRQAICVSGKCPLCQRRLHLKDIHPLYF